MKLINLALAVGASVEILFFVQENTLITPAALGWLTGTAIVELLKKDSLKDPQG